MRGKATDRRKLDRRIALLETALWWVRIKFPDDAAAIAAVEWKLEELRGQKVAA